MTQTKKQPTHHTATDSFLGSILATAFLGGVYGADVADTWRAGETAAAVCEDRRANGNFQLGVNKSLAGTFTRNSQGIEEPAKIFGLFAAAPAPAPRAFAL